MGSGCSMRTEGATYVEEDASYITKPCTPAEIEEIRKMQEISSSFVNKYLYYGVPIRASKQFKGQDECAQIWIEPLPEIVEEALSGSGEKSAMAVELLKSAPNGVLIDLAGNVHIHFSLADVRYKLTYSEITNALKLRELEKPKPPALKKATCNSIALCWDQGQLPLPFGIIQQVEVQYIPSAVVKRLAPTEIATCPKWSVLTSKTFSQGFFGSDTLKNLSPGVSYTFRMRYRDNGSWSSMSELSNDISTSASIPSRPPPPVCIGITSSVAEFSWKQLHIPDNGSPIFEYILRGRAVGDIFEEMYRGPRLSYLALGLYPEYAYTFQLAAVNEVGTSEYSNFSSVITQLASSKRTIKKGRGAANKTDGAAAAHVPNAAAAKAAGYTEAQIEAANACRDAWEEFWDPKTEQAFYFNKIICTRQLEIPAVLQPGNESDCDSGAEEGNFSSDSDVSNGESDDDNGEYSSHDDQNSANVAVTDGVINGTQKRKRRTHKSRRKILAKEMLESALKKEFRRKRYRLLLALRQHFTKQAVARNGASTAFASSTATRALSDIDMSSSPLLSYGVSTSITAVGGGNGGSSSATVAHIVLRRDHLLYDGFVAFTRELSTYDLTRKRLRVEFVGEEGIDSGGLSKEALLLLSKQAAWFMKHKGWVKVQKGAFSGDRVMSNNGSSTRRKKNKRNINSEFSSTIGGDEQGYFFEEDHCIDMEEAKQAHHTANIGIGVAAVSNPVAAAAALSLSKGSTEEQAAMPSEQSISCLAGDVTANCKMFAHFLGRLLGKALFDRQLIEFPLSPMLLMYLTLGLDEAFSAPSNKQTGTSSPGKLKPCFTSSSLENEILEANGLSSKKQGSAATDIDTQRPNAKLNLKKAKTQASIAALREQRDSEMKSEQLAQVKYMLSILQGVEQELYKSLHWILNNNIEGIIFEKFSVTIPTVTLIKDTTTCASSGGASILKTGTKELALCARGEEIDVNEENKVEYIKLMILFKTKFSVSASLFAFVEAFHSLIPLKLIKDAGISRAELQDMLIGKSLVNVEEMRAYCIYQPSPNNAAEVLYAEADAALATQTEGGSAAAAAASPPVHARFDENHLVVGWFWRAMREYDDAHRRAVLHFFTGSSRVPMDGFDPPLNITQGSSTEMRIDSLPRAHTCFNQLVLPEYTDFKTLKDKLWYAVINTGGFDLA